MTLPLTGLVTEMGDWLATIESTAASEVVAEFQTCVLGNFFDALESTIDRDAIVGMEAGNAFDLLRQLNLQAKVRVTSGTDVLNWSANLCALMAVQIQRQASSDLLCGNRPRHWSNQLTTNSVLIHPRLTMYGATWRGWWLNYLSQERVWRTDA